MFVETGQRRDDEPAKVDYLKEQAPDSQHYSYSLRRKLSSFDSTFQRGYKMTICSWRTQPLLRLSNAAKCKISAIDPLWLSTRSFGSVRCKALQQELADQICRRVSARVCQAIQKDQRSTTVRRWIVEVRNSAGGEVPKHVRIVWSQSSIVVSGHDGGRYRTQRARIDYYRDVSPHGMTLGPAATLTYQPKAGVQLRH